MAKQKRHIEYRYYEVPSGHYCLTLLGDQWVKNYGHDVVNNLHFHNFLEVGYCYYGQGVVTIENDDYHYTGELCTIIPQNIPHFTCTDGDGIDKWEFMYIDIEGFVRQEFKSGRLRSEEILKQINKQAYVISWKDNAILSAAILGIMDEYRNKKPYYKEAVKGHLTTMVVELLRLSEDTEAVTPYLMSDKKMNKYIENSVKYISEHYAEEIKMADVAEICGLSESHFRRIFEESMSMKPLDYVNMIRIDKACELIADEDMAMEEIGYRVGYQTPSTFNRNFKKLTGKSPYQWKKEETHLEGGAKNYKISAKKGW